MTDAAASDVVLVEDEPNLRELVADVLAADGVRVAAFASIAEAERHLARHAPDLLLVDVKLPDGDGLALLERLRAAGSRTPAIVMTAFGTVERAVQALHAGAADFLVKPCDNARLRAAVAAALASARHLEEVELRAGTVAAGATGSAALVGADGGLKDVAALLPRVAASQATVLIQGESGTGKELVARAIHAASPRLDGPFVSLNCAAIAPTLLESELFGFERGAFTGAHAQRKGYVEAAQGGTLFLDEIGDMALDAQARLLRVLQEHEITRVGGRQPVKVDVRIIAATHRDLAAWAKEGRFRDDLLYRLDVVRVRLPPLRERRRDIAGLLEHFLAKHAARHRRPRPAVDADTLRSALGHAWPGNVRELENFAERAVVFGRFDGAMLSPPVAAAAADGVPQAVAALVDGPAPAVARLGDGARPALAETSPGAPVAAARTLRAAVAEAERGAVVAALRQAQGNKAEAARLLGVSYKTLFNKIHEHGIREDLKIE